MAKRTFEQTEPFEDASSEESIQETQYAGKRPREMYAAQLYCDEELDDSPDLGCYFKAWPDMTSRDIASMC